MAAEAAHCGVSTVPPHIQTVNRLPASMSNVCLRRLDVLDNQLLHTSQTSIKGKARFNYRAGGCRKTTLLGRTNAHTQNKVSVKTLRGRFYCHTTVASIPVSLQAPAALFSANHWLNKGLVMKE